MNRSLLALVLALAAPAAPASAADVYLEVDGAYYLAPSVGAEPGFSIQKVFVELAIIARPVEMIACQRRNGGALGFSDVQLFYGWSLELLPVHRFNYRVFPSGVGVLQVQTVTGDIECLGEVPQPPLGVADLLFRDGFEDWAAQNDPIFASGFDF